MKDKNNINDLINIKANDKNDTPLISVVMSCYNRQNYVAQAIESILNQTYTNFEFIIIDDCSTDNTYKIIKKYVKRDKRIIALRNKVNKGIVYALNRGLKLAKGKYIARMDDDDISLPQRFEKQVKYMEENPDVVVLGSDVKSFCDEDKDYSSWVDAFDADELALILNFKCSISHPNVIIRKDFLDKHSLSYLKEYEFAEDYALWAQVMLKGGKIENLKEPLLLHRVSKKSIMRTSKSGNKSLENQLKIRTHLLGRFFSKIEIDDITKNKIKPSFRLEDNKIKDICEVLSKMKERDEKGFYTKKAYEKFIEKFVGKKQRMHIFFSINDSFAQHLCVLIASILKNSTPLDEFNFYVLNKGDLSEESKRNIQSLKALKDFEVEFIEVDYTLFDECHTSQYCAHISKEAYFRYIIPQLKPSLEKSLYLDCDIVVEDSLNLLYNTDLKDNYVGVVEDFWEYARIIYKKDYNLNNGFNSGVLLINNKKCLEDNIIEKLFFNTEILNLQETIKWVEQDVLNYTFNNKCLFLNPKYNVQYSIFTSDNNATNYKDCDYFNSRYRPTIIHFTGELLKPWQYTSHPLWHRYWHYIKFTPYAHLYESKYKELYNVSNLRLYGAADRIKQRLSYKIGEELLKTRNFKRVLSLLSRIIKVKKLYKEQQKAYRAMVKLYPHLKLHPLSQYLDYNEVKNIEQHLTYRLGNLLVKHPFAFIFRARKVYKEWKKEKKR